jgi:hypothetical protein
VNVTLLALNMKGRNGLGDIDKWEDNTKATLKEITL